MVQNKKKRTKMNEVEDETHLYLQRRNYADLRTGWFDYITSTENITLAFGNKLKKLKLLFVSGSSNYSH